MADKLAAILIKKAARIYDKMAEPEMNRYDLTESQYKVLKYLYTHPEGTVRQVDIERYYSLTHPTAIGLLHTLEEKGFINRTVNPDDARSRIVTLSEKAKEEHKELIEVGERLEAELTANLSEQEKEQLLELLEKMVGREE